MKKILCCLIPAIAGFLFICGLIPRWTLEVKERKGGEIFLQERANPGDLFYFRYTHSVEKTPVEAVFEIGEGGFLRMVEMQFSSHGAGLPAVGERRDPTGSRFVAKGESRQEKITFLFIPLNQPVLRFKDKEVRITPGGREEGVLEISVRRESWLRFLLKKRVTLTKIVL